MTSTQIRQATVGDAQAISGLLYELGYGSDQEFVKKQIDFFKGDCYHTLVCEHDHTVVAFLSMHWFSMFHSEGMMGRITAMCVSESVRDLGIGGSLLAEAEKLFYENDCTCIEVTSSNRRTMAHRFYVKHGYAEDSLRFIKKLSPLSKEKS